MKVISSFSLTLLLGISNLALGQLFKDQSFNLPPEFADERTMDVELQDLDGDAYPDLILAKEFKANAILWNDGQGNFEIDSNRLLPSFRNLPNGWTGEDSEDILIFDADVDGDKDLLFVSEDTDQHELLLNDGKGKFSISSYQFPFKRANAVISGDFNGDRLPDVLFGNTGANQLFLNQGNGTFYEDTMNIWPANGDHTQDLKGGDFDNDGDFDIIEGCEVGGSNYYENLGGRFVERNIQLKGAQMNQYETRKVVVADVDNDLDLDLLFCNVAWTNGNDPQDLLFLNDGKAEFTNVTEDQMNFYHPFTLDALFYDWDKDGFLDLLMTHQAESRNLSVYFNNPNKPGWFREDPQTVFPFFTINTGIALATEDINRDGHFDIYFGTFGDADRLMVYQQPSLVLERGTTNFKIGPNPVQSKMYIQGAEQEMNTLEITNLMGQVMMENRVLHGDSIPVEELLPGIYLLHIKNRTGELVETIPFVKA